VSIRLRVALVFTLALAAAFTLGGWLFVSQLSAAMLRSTDAALAARLSQASRYTADDEEGNLPPGFLTGQPFPGEYVVQVINPSRHVIRSSQNAGKTPLLSGAELRRAEHGEVLLTRNLSGKPERILAGPYAGEHGGVAIAGVSLAPSHSTLRQVTGGLLIGGAVFVAAAGFGAYWLARAALSPVERLRREVASLSERDAGASVRVPRTHDEIAALAGTMNAILARLHRALARQRAFVADASHELRTPFAVLRGELELAARPGRSREELAAAVASAADESARLTRITDDLLLLASSDEDRLTLRREQVNIGALLARAAELAAVRAGTVGVSCRVDAPSDIEALVDPGRLRQAVDNLIDNALRFAPRDTEIVISSRITGPDLVIQVRDAGPGFPDDFLPYAFERFRRPDTGRARSDGGAGLGLAIVHAIAVAHGGRATVRNEPKGGAAAGLELPLSVGRPAEVPVHPDQD
jgi:two-component system, OmpR family, sensor kinase